MTNVVFRPRPVNLQEDCVLKLKSLYTPIEQLYARGLFTIKAMWGDRESVKFISDMLKRLLTIPKHIEEMKKSTARKGLITALRRSLAYAPELKLEEIAGGFPEYKDDGSEFAQEDYA
ncbi:hypothetical protein D1007_58962 [Hordeum vulgare]|nr:hypothetical protein D1007_58962 [Hordeum vulgare]